MILTDTHTHLYSEEFSDDRDQMMQRAFDAGVKRLFVPSIDSSYTQAMYELEASLTVIQPPGTLRFRDLVPEVPAGWQRRFPVFGAVSGTVGCLAAMEALKLLAGFGEPLFNRLLRLDLRTMNSRVVALR